MNSTLKWVQNLQSTRRTKKNCSRWGREKSVQPKCFQTSLASGDLHFPGSNDITCCFPRS